MWKEFKEFINKGNIVDLAVAVVLAAAFGKIVTEFTKGILTPLIGILMGGKNVPQMTFKAGGAVFNYGVVIDAAIAFLITAIVLFMVVKTYNKFQRKEEEPAQAPAGPSEAELLAEIRDLLKQQRA